MDLLPSLVSPQRLPFTLGCVVLLILTATQAVITFGQAGDRPLAVVNGRSISEEQVESLVIAQTLPLEEKLYAIRKAALENLITTVVLEIEAKKRGVSVAELRKELVAGDVHVTPGEVESAYSENASFFASMSPDEAKERLRLDLENQKRIENYRQRLGKLRQGLRIDLLIKEPRLPEITGVSLSPSLGPPHAPITIVEFSDFQCTYCRSAQKTLKELLLSYPRDVKLVFKHLPLQIHEQAHSAAHAAAFCADQQNSFWKYHDGLFAIETFTAESFHELAANLHLDLKQFGNCLTSSAVREAIQSNINEARKFGITSTPTFIVNGKLVRGAITLEQFKALVDRELQASHKSLPSRQPSPARKD